MKVIMSGGGTGGHIYPAIAIADAIKKRFPDAKILFTGNKDALESKITVSAGYEFVPIECRGFNRSLSPKNIKAAFLALTSPLKAKRLLKEFKPDIVIGTGGYVSWPTVKAAAMLRIPNALHESNSVPGLAVKMLSGCVKRIWTNYDETIEAIGRPEKSLRVGNPLRDSFSSVSSEEAKKTVYGGKDYRCFVLSYGGSIGAERLNECAVEFMKEYASVNPDVKYVHITGKGKYAETYEKFCAAGLEGFDNIELLDYTNDMPTLMAAADVVVSRAGALTLSELALTKKAAILIPSPNVTNNHQYWNARALSDKGAAILIEEKELDSARFISEISKLVDNASARIRLQGVISSFAYEDTCDRIVEDIIKITGGKK